MLFPVKKAFKLRESLDFKASGLIAEQKKVSQSGVKSQTPLVKLKENPSRDVLQPQRRTKTSLGV